MYQTEQLQDSKKKKKIPIQLTNIGLTTILCSPKVRELFLFGMAQPRKTTLW